MHKKTTANPQGKDDAEKLHQVCLAVRNGGSYMDYKGLMLIRKLCVTPFDSM